jgi:hypothetical protein
MILVFPERSWYNAPPLEMKKNPTPEIQALIDKAKIPPGCNFQEAFQRLSPLRENLYVKRTENLSPGA